MKYVCGWQCDNCQKIDSNLPWTCPCCKKEVCEYCFGSYHHCKECSKGKTDSELIAASEQIYGEE